MIKKIEYKDLRTMADVRAERIRVNRDIFYVRNGWRNDLHSFAGMFTWDHWAGVLMDRVPVVSPTIRSFLTGYRFVSSVFGKSRKKNRC